MEKIFKAKRLDNGKWVEFDSIIHCNEKCYFFKYGSGDFDSIPLSKGMEIDKDTICQYTGIKDSQGNRIFEGDEFTDNTFARMRKGTWVEDCGDYIEPLYYAAELLTLSGHNIQDRG